MEGYNNTDTMKNINMESVLIKTEVKKQKDMSW
jgi:hypothetical protein